ncbi:MAG: bifunctional phosphoribosylaminoimidazolecarboxamide formyltransferase/IMP cyclohydrolase [Acidobacteria bacterium]|nr:bifunctional phosphoribosylaminoimidazolecarboxamide formyltransferase/IMP cyclohydrolase [Acidobacteriota bacterium]
MNRIRTALISLSDKRGLPDLARGLHALGVDLVSTGGTAAEIRRADVPVREVSELTGFPEILDGRVKTLHPNIHGGILARRDRPEDLWLLDRMGIAPIDLVAVNLYPFRETVEEGAGVEAVIEQVDIGGPCLLRASAKNFRHVTVVVDPADYPRVLAEIETGGGTTLQTRLELARKAFAHTSAYDAHIVEYYARLDCCDEKVAARAAEEGLPDCLHLVLQKYQDLRYGENPHQRGALYVDELEAWHRWSLPEQLHGKELSYNNLLDLDAAVGLVGDFTGCACTVVKHGNPCGAALGRDPGDAFLRALRTDPDSAFGSIVAFNRPVDEACAAEIARIFVEVAAAPAFTDGAREILCRRKNLRVLLCADAGSPRPAGLRVRTLAFGALVQEEDVVVPAPEDLRTVTRKTVPPELLDDLRFAWTCAKHVRSNAVVTARDGRLLGVGAGQMSRVDSARLSVSKSREPLAGAVMASDAFIPFRDTVDIAADAGVVAVIQTGGSIRDEEVIAAADERGIAMVFTGMRHFRH